MNIYATGLLLSLMMTACSLRGDFSPSDAGAGNGGPGAIGAECSSASDCLNGKHPVCWRQTLINRRDYLPTPRGYCSSTCVDDHDCGAGATCTNFGNDGFYCLATCTSSEQCRGHYFCAYGIGASSDYCFPEAAFDCDPTSTDGSCVVPGSSLPGGCLRGAYGPGVTGNCYAACNIGTATCETAPDNTHRQCFYVDATGTDDSDTWRGPVCLDKVSSPPPAATGNECLDPSTNLDFFNLCVDGNECDTQGDNLCHPLCYLSGGQSGIAGAVDAGVAPADCPQGTVCKDRFNAANQSAAWKRIGLCEAP